VITVNTPARSGASSCPSPPSSSLGRAPLGG
jgi:hypothetical protein